MTQRTPLQNNALHLWFEMVADTLNAHGADMQAVFAVKQVSVPWTKDRVKECLYRPLLEATTGKVSTADADTDEYDPACMVLSKHMAEKMGIVLPPFPDRYGPAQ